MLKVENLTKLFKKKDQKTKVVSEVGIRSISFNAQEGRIFGLIGANGAGKTTTMRIIANLTDPQKGSITLDDKDYSHTKNIKGMLGFVSGETQIFDRLTPYEILKIFGNLAGIKGKELEEKIQKLSEKLEMNEFLNIPAITFSTGMKQKVSIARALITDPKVLVFDEVTNGLDIFAAKAVKDIILELKKENKIILYSTHIMPDADELCDDVAIIHKGKVLLEGNVQELLKKNNVKNINDLFFDQIEKIDSTINI